MVGDGGRWWGIVWDGALARGDAALAGLQGCALEYARLQPLMQEVAASEPVLERYTCIPSSPPRTACPVP